MREGAGEFAKASVRREGPGCRRQLGGGWNAPHLRGKAPQTRCLVKKKRKLFCGKLGQFFRRAVFLQQATEHLGGQLRGREGEPRPECMIRAGKGVDALGAGQKHQLGVPPQEREKRHPHLRRAEQKFQLFRGENDNVCPGEQLPRDLPAGPLLPPAGARGQAPGRGTKQVSAPGSRAAVRPLNGYTVAGCRIGRRRQRAGRPRAGRAPAPAAPGQTAARRCARGKRAPRRRPQTSKVVGSVREKRMCAVSTPAAASVEAARCPNGSSPSWARREAHPPCAGTGLCQHGGIPAEARPKAFRVSQRGVRVQCQQNLTQAVDGMLWNHGTPPFWSFPVF